MINSTINILKIVIADDHKIFRDGLKLFIRKAKHLELVGEASDGKELVEVVQACDPDVILTDIRMPEMDGIAAAKHIKAIRPNIAIIALSMLNEESAIVDMLEAGALGYLLKDAGKDEILEAIKTVADGKPYYSNSFSPKLLTMIASSSFNPYKEEEPMGFSDRELQIIEWICQERTSREIANYLGLSSRTIEWHRRIITEKINAKGTAGIVLYAIKNNLIKI
ncbi:MAG: LuxR family transcriptional regulator [Segetibacter sp.]|nr:LuxR family transcriptional regulator [Segetibacter sp.]